MGRPQDVDRPPTNLPGNVLGTTHVAGKPQGEDVPVGEAEPGNAAFGRLRRRLVPLFGHPLDEGHLS